MRAVVAVLVALAGSGAVGQRSPLVSAASPQMSLGVDSGTGVITGYYEDYTGWDSETRAPRFSCIFYFRGELTAKPPYRITSWWPGLPDKTEVIEGTIRPMDDDATDHDFVVRLKGAHGGCSNAGHFAFAGEDVEFYGVTVSTWKSIRVVAAEKAYFYDEPNTNARRKAYVVQDNPLRVYKATPGWVYAEYVAYRGAKAVSTMGWIREQDLYSDLPPARSQGAKK